MFLLGIINAMMNLKQFGPLVVIHVETNWPGRIFFGPTFNLEFFFNKPFLLDN